MALPVINESDFLGDVKISTDPYKGVRLLDYIREYYPEFIQKAIGYESLEIVENLSSLTKKWEDLFNGVYYYNRACKRTLKIKGLKWCAVRYIYFMFVVDNFQSTGTGKVKNQSEVSSNLTNTEISQLVAVRSNRASFEVNHAIRNFILNYSDFEGTIDSFTDNGGGSYTINSQKTTYLEDGDEVSINGKKYEVSNVQDDASFDISAQAGLTFDGVYIYSPFKSVYLSNLGYVVS